MKPLRELTDEEVFGTPAARELSDAEVFGSAVSELSDADVLAPPADGGIRQPSAQWSDVARSLPTQAVEAARLGTGGVMRALTDLPPPDAVMARLPPRRISVVDTPEGPKTVYADSARKAALERYRAGGDTNRDPNDPIAAVVGTVRDTGREMTEKARLNLAEATPENLTFWQEATVDAARSLGIAIPGLTLSVATGSPLPALATMGAAEYGTSFDEALRSGLGEQDAARYAGINAGVEVLTEKIPLGTLLKRGTPFFQRLLKLYGQELVGENIATVLQDANEFATFNPDATMDNWMTGYIVKRPAQAAKTSAATLITSTVQGGAAHGAISMMDRAERSKRTPTPDDAAGDTSPDISRTPAGPITGERVAGEVVRQPDASPAPAPATMPVAESATPGAAHTDIANGRERTGEQSAAAPARATQADTPLPQTREPIPGQTNERGAAHLERKSEFTAQDIDRAAHEAATSPLNQLPEPTEAQREAGNYTKGKIKLHGLDISIENPKGSTRSGVGTDDKPWRTQMKAHYGYLRGVRARDKDHLDVFLGPNASDPKMPVFVVDQIDPQTGKYDEAKVLIGYPTEQAARDGYLANYSPGWQGLGAMKRFTLPEFKLWTKVGVTTRAVALKGRVSSTPKGDTPSATLPGQMTVPATQPIRRQMSKPQGQVSGSRTRSTRFQSVKELAAGDDVVRANLAEGAVADFDEFVLSDRRIVKFLKEQHPEYWDIAEQLRKAVPSRDSDGYSDAVERIAQKLTDDEIDTLRKLSAFAAEAADDADILASGVAPESRRLQPVDQDTATKAVTNAARASAEATRSTALAVKEITSATRELRDAVKDIRAARAEARTRIEQGERNDPRTDHSVGAAEAAPITPQSRLGEILDSIQGGLKSVGKEVIDVTGGKAISYIDDLARISPTAKALRDTFEYTEFSTEPIPPSYYERVSLKTGEYMTRIDNALEDLRGAFRKKMPDKVNDKLLEALRGGKATAPVAEPALKLRLLLNEVRDYAREQGVEVGFIENYFPRLYKKDLLRTDTGRDAFARVLMKHGIDATTADSIAVKIANADGILVVERGSSERVNPEKLDEAFEPGRVAQDSGPRRDKQLETARKLARIPDAELAPFLESNVAAVLRGYIERVVKRAEYARAFGAGEGKLNQMVRDIITEASQSGRPVKPAEIERIYGLADAMQGQYRPILSSVGRGANQLVTTYQYIRTLPLATISSLSEPFLVIARGRPGTIPRAVARSLNHAVRETLRSVYRKVPKVEATKALEDIGLGLDAALSERLTASFGGEVTKFTSAFFKLNFLHQWTRFTRVLANEAGKLMVERHLRDLVKGVSANRAAQIRRELAELGVDYKAGMKWIEDGAPHDHDFFDTVKAAGLRFTNEVIMNPRATNRPMWHSNPHYHTLAQLKGFQTVFGNTVLPRWYEMIANRGVYQGVRNATKIATAGVLMVLTAMLGNELRELIKHGPGGNPKFKNEDPAKTIYRGVERAGFLGVSQFASDAMFAHRFGSSSIAQLGGPTVSQVNELIEAGGAAAEDNMRPLAREVVNAIPFANVVPSVRRDITDAMVEPKDRRRRER